MLWDVSRCKRNVARNRHGTLAETLIQIRSLSETGHTTNPCAQMHVHCNTVRAFQRTHQLRRIDSNRQIEHQPHGVEYKRQKQGLAMALSSATLRRPALFSLCRGMHALQLLLSLRSPLNLCFARAAAAAARRLRFRRISDSHDPT